MKKVDEKCYVLKITGYLFNDDMLHELYELAEYIKSLSEKGKTFIIVVGGGSYLRSVLSFLRKYSYASEYDLDILGIYFSRLNAYILLQLLQPLVVESIPTSVEEALTLYFKFRKNIVMGGVSPGFSTNAVSAYIASRLSSPLINMTRVGAIYDKDPEKFSDAKKINVIHIDRLIEIIEKYKESAGYYPLFDKSSLNIIKEYNIPTCIIAPSRMSLHNYIEKGECGTIIIT